MTQTDQISVEVAYARPDVQRIVALLVPPGTTARAALRLSGLPEMFPEIDAENCALGIFGVVLENTEQPLHPGDRVEVYRPLSRDPRETRRALAAMGKTMAEKSD